MKMSDWLRAVLLPARSISVLPTLVMFWLLIMLANAAGRFGIWLMIILLPALFRYLTTLVEAIGNGREPETPGSESFRWIGESWRLFPVVIALFSAGSAYWLYDIAGLSAAVALIAAIGAIYPAILGVLSITHSPLQSVNPVALIQFVRRVGPHYVIAPIYLVIVAYLSYITRAVPYFALLIELFLIFSLHAVIGQVMQPYGLFEDVHIPDALAANDSEIAAGLERSRAAVLSHAYGFVSRGNRDGGFRHVTDSIAKDPDSVGAWAWFFERMAQWEQKQHALFFAQLYVHDMLQHGEDVGALKLILRCRMIDENFRPAAEDIPAAVAAATRSGNIELATVLKRA